MTNWHAQIGKAMTADRIVDRLVHVEHWIQRRGGSPPKNPRLAARKERKDH